MFYVMISFPTPATPPILDITTNPTGDLYAGTNLTLTCGIEIPEHVNSPITVVAVWTGPDGSVLNDSRITISDAILVKQLTYDSTAEISPLRTKDGGLYSVTVYITANTDCILTAMDNILLNVSVLGKLACNLHFGEEWILDCCLAFPPAHRSTQSSRDN